jgi:hypothetical protein
VIAGPATQDPMPVDSSVLHEKSLVPQFIKTSVFGFQQGIFDSRVKYQSPRFDDIVE